jgi:hypothetical protein
VAEKMPRSSTEAYALILRWLAGCTAGRCSVGSAASTGCCSSDGVGSDVAAPSGSGVMLLLLAVLA